MWEEISECMRKYPKLRRVDMRGGERQKKGAWERRREHGKEEGSMGKKKGGTIDSLS